MDYEEITRELYELGENARRAAGLLDGIEDASTEEQEDACRKAAEYLRLERSSIEIAEELTT